MRRLPIFGSMVVLLAGVAWAEEPPIAVKTATTPEVLRAEIEALKPAPHAWRAIAWKTCPLEALRQARQQRKPVIAWVFLGIPTDERC